MPSGYRFFEDDDITYSTLYFAQGLRMSKWIWLNIFVKHSVNMLAYSGERDKRKPHSLRKSAQTLASGKKLRHVLVGWNFPHSFIHSFILKYGFWPKILDNASFYSPHTWGTLFCFASALVACSRLLTAIFYTKCAFLFRHLQDAQSYLYFLLNVIKILLLLLVVLRSEPKSLYH